MKRIPISDLDDPFSNERGITVLVSSPQGGTVRISSIDKDKQPAAVNNFDVDKVTT
jgi:hypothetical protein